MFFQVVDFDHLFHLLFFLPDEGKTENCSEESLDLFFFHFGSFFCYLTQDMEWQPRQICYPTT